jgi:hypothetical protein
MQVFVKQPSRGALSPDGQWKVTGGQLLNTRTGQSIPQEGDYFASLAGMWGADESDYDDAVNMALGEGVKWAPDSRAFTVPSREKRESYFSIYVLADGKWVNFGLDSDEPLGHQISITIGKPALTISKREDGSHLEFSCGRMEGRTLFPKLFTSKESPG